jgi:hypothetical protein
VQVRFADSRNVCWRRSVPQQPFDTGGAPRRFDTEAFLIEAFRVVYETPPPKTEAELRRRALDAYAEAGHAGGTPSDDWARDKIIRFWRKLNLGIRER